MMPRITFCSPRWRLCSPPSSSHAAVSAEEAAKLKTDAHARRRRKSRQQGRHHPGLGRRLHHGPAGYKNGRPRRPFRGREAAALDHRQEHGPVRRQADRRRQGAAEEIPADFRIDVYPTHRTAAAPQWVYDNTFKNATRAKTTNNGVDRGSLRRHSVPDPEGRLRGHLEPPAAWGGGMTSLYDENFRGTADGNACSPPRRQQRAVAVLRPERQAERFDGVYRQLRVVQTDPPFKSGEAFLGSIPSTGRARRGSTSPASVACARRRRRLRHADDVTSGAQLRRGLHLLRRLDRFDWKLVGKKEMFIPYNNQKLFATPTDSSSHRTT